MNGISIKEEEIDKKMTQVLFAGFFQKISYKSRWIPQYPSSFNRLVHSFTIFFAFVKEQERTSKPVFHSVLVI
jgi:hypothetical protein